MAKVSIVVPVYNVEQYMRATIDALCNQSLQDIEIILVDDGSTDSSGKICDDYAEKDERVIVLHIENDGVCVARNKGIAVASGEYISFCDSDDMPDNDLYETLLNLLLENNTDMSIAQTLVVYEDGSTWTPAKNMGVFIWDKPEEILKEFLQGRFGIAVYKMLFKADLAKSVYFEKGRKINEDKMYVFEALQKVNSICYKDEAKYKYFRRSGSASCSKFSEKYFDTIYFSEKIYGTVQKKYPSIQNYAKAGLVISHLSVLKLMYLEDGENDFKSEWNHSVKYLRSIDRKFCKEYLSKNDYIKWSALKINTSLFKFLTKTFSKN